MWACGSVFGWPQHRNGAEFLGALASAPLVDAEGSGRADIVAGAHEQLETASYVSWWWMDGVLWLLLVVECGDSCSKCCRDSVLSLSRTAVFFVWLCCCCCCFCFVFLLRKMFVVSNFGDPKRGQHKNECVCCVCPAYLIRIVNCTRVSRSRCLGHGDRVALPTRVARYNATPNSTSS